MTLGDLLAKPSSAERWRRGRLRRLVCGTVPNAAEEVYTVWCGIGYRHPDAGHFCGIFPFKTHVGLAFEFRGAASGSPGLSSGRSNEQQEGEVP
jgi:hypothetical protein